MKKTLHKKGPVPSLSRGFTLIELLVVVAIIALLASAILASLGSARTKARVSRAKSEISSMRAQAELYANNHDFSYGGDDGNPEGCDADLVKGTGPDTLLNLYTSVESFASEIECSIGATKWAVAAKLDGKVFCADSNGVSAESSAQATGAVVAGSQCNL